jgi:hypothetical protein
MSMIKCAACCVLVLLISAPVTSARAGNRYRCRSCNQYGSGSYWGGYAGSGGYRSGGYNNASVYPAIGYYYDVRDTRTYAAQGYNVPVTVPLPPITRTYNYGWGIPSARLSPVGGYSRWYPDVPFTQNGGRLPVNYQVIYQPTDTTQTGIYYTYVPTWQPR